MENYNFNSCENAVGKELIVQICIKSYIENNINSVENKNKAFELYKMFGDEIIDVDNLYITSLDNCKFILNIMEKFEIHKHNSNMIYNYCCTLDSIKYQINNYGI